MNKLTQNFLSLVNLVKPPRTLSWQTVTLIGISLWVIALLLGLNGNLRSQNTFSILGCIVVIISFAWFTKENPLTIHGLSLSTWVLVEFICLFAASLWQEFAPFILIAWPALSAVIAAWPDFLAVEKKFKNFKNEQRFKLLIWLLIHLIISCWITFTLIIQNWVLQYPSLLADDLSQSNFLVTIKPFFHPVTEGEKVLNVMEQMLKTKIDGKSWIIAENWFKDENQLKKLLNQAKQGIPEIREKDLWKFRTEVTAQKTGYNLLMVAEWHGPSYNTQSYWQKVCQVNSVTRQPTSVNDNLRQVTKNNSARVAITPQVKIPVKPVKVANVKCQSVTKQIIGQNQPKSSPKL